MFLACSYSPLLFVWNDRFFHLRVTVFILSDAQRFVTDRSYWFYIMIDMSLLWIKYVCFRFTCACIFECGLSEYYNKVSPIWRREIIKCVMNVSDYKNILLITKLFSFSDNLFFHHTTKASVGVRVTKKFKTQFSKNDTSTFFQAILIFVSRN